MMTNINEIRINTTLSILNALRLSASDESEFFNLIDNRLTLMLDKVLAIVKAQDNSEDLEHFKHREVIRD